MTEANTKLEIVNESPKNSNRTNKIDPEALELVFGKPKSPKPTSPGTGFINTEKMHSQPHSDGKPTDSERSSQPLLEPDRDKQAPPLAGPEVDDLDEEVAAHNNKPFSGIDDGLLEPIKPDVIDVGSDDPATGTVLDEGATEDGKWPWHADEPDYPHDNPNGLSPRFGDDRPVSPIPSSIDVNTYQQKKNLAQGMMDLALLSANANQLRYVLESASSHPYFYSSLAFISLSIIFQVAVGVGLIMNSRYDVNNKKEIGKADRINNLTVLGIFLVTIVNVFIAAFSVSTPTVRVTARAG